MKRRTRLALSALLGVAAAAVAMLAIGNVRADAARAEQEVLERYGGDLVAVCVARRDIDPGEKIDEGNVEVVEWVSSLLPDDALTSLEDVAGRLTTARIPKRAPLSSVYFEKEESAIEVPKGKVAVSVASDAEHAVGGALVQGESVDVYLAGDALADRLTTAEVLDTSALADGGGDVSWVTLAVDSAAVQELLAATTKGMVWLVLPNAAGAEDGVGVDAGQKIDAEEAAGVGADANANETEKAADAPDDASSAEDAAGSDNAGDMTGKDAQ